MGQSRQTDGEAPAMDADQAMSVRERISERRMRGEMVRQDARTCGRAVRPRDTDFILPVAGKLGNGLLPVKEFGFHVCAAGIS